MSYMLKFHQQQYSTDTQSQYQKLNKLIFQQQQQYFSIIWLKYFQNFYDQSASYFIVMLSQQKQNQENQTISSQQPQLIKMKKIYPHINKETLKNQNKQQPKKQSQQNSLQIEFTIDEKHYLDMKRIIAANFVHQNILIVLNDPFQLYFVTKHKLGSKPFKIILQHSFQLNNVIATFSFQTNDQQRKKQPYQLTLYGRDKVTQTNKLATINLVTFDMRETTQSKDYSPKLFDNGDYFQMFHDDRLFVFGGHGVDNKEKDIDKNKNKSNKNIEELLWSFDLSKGYWFALEMRYKQLSQSFYNCLTAVYDSGKIILFKNCSFYLLEIYQCKITKLELQQKEKFQKIQQQQNIIGMLVYEKRLYFYTKRSFLGISLILQKQKKQTKSELEMKKDL